MKLIRFGTAGSEKPGVQLEDGKRLDVSAFGQDYTESFFENDGINKLKTWLIKNGDSCTEISAEERLGSPTVRPSKLICVGLNYVKHAEETGAAIPNEPILF